MTLADSSELSAAVSNSEHEQLGVDAVPEGAFLSVRTILTLRSACRSPDQSSSGPPFACHTSPQRVCRPLLCLVAIVLRVPWSNCPPNFQRSMQYAARF